VSKGVKNFLSIFCGGAVDVIGRAKNQIRAYGMYNLVMKQFVKSGMEFCGEDARGRRPRRLQPLIFLASSSRGLAFGICRIW